MRRLVSIFSILPLALAALLVTQTHAQMTFGGSKGNSGSESGGGGSSFGELKVGDPAPGLDIEFWYPDEPQKLENGVVYIIDFWSVANPKCLKSIPMLAALQQKHRNRGLKVISVTKDKDEIVQAFRQINLDLDLHTFAIDNKEKTTRAWQNAANAKAIPTTFIVDRAGKIVYIGDPFNPRFPDIVVLTILDRYDPKLFERVGPIIDAGRRAAGIKNFNESYRLFDMAIKEEPRILAPFAVDKLKIMLTSEKDYDRAYKYARELLKNYESDPFTLATMARMIATDAKVETRDFELAIELAQKAVDRSRREDPEYLAVMSDVLTAKGDYMGAVKWESEAYRMAVPVEKSYHKRRLEELQIAAEGGAKPALIGRSKDETVEAAAPPVSGKTE